MSRDPEIREFVDSLAEAEMPDDRSVNVYRDAVRCANLIRWLSIFEDTAQSVIFVGEAPGRDGGAITGIPFVSPKVLTSARDAWGEFGAGTKYGLAVGENPLQREATATQFWRYVSEHFSELPRPLTWNAYPFWPRQRDSSKNRKPTISEMRFGCEWLRRIIELHPNASIVAVGRSAEYALGYINVNHVAVRHPSHGGASDFDDGLAGVAAALRG